MYVSMYVRMYASVHVCACVCVCIKIDLRTISPTFTKCCEYYTTRIYANFL